MLRGQVLVGLLSLLPVIVKASVCTDHLAPFDCPNGGVCTKWNDGCNECSCIEGLLKPSCTDSVCPCQEDVTCAVPSCIDNLDCVLRGKEDRQDEEEPTTTIETTATEGAALAQGNASFLAGLDGLNSRISTFSQVKPTNFTDWLAECTESYKRAGFPPENIPREYISSNYYLKEMPSGLCMLTMATAFQGGTWNDVAQAALYQNDLLVTSFDDLMDSLPPMALPAFMSFPESAKDIVEIVKYANQHEKKVSIKNSGHSYTGASTSADSVQINLRKYPKYSFTDVYVCEKGMDYEALIGPPCKLALARGKTAVARVGGGQGNDDIYRSVMNFNYKEPREKKYTVLGGDDGMVGGGGGFMQGGGLGRGEERLWGNGADQVLELEMVLPDGTHVKFGPTEWEQKEGFIYPQTTKVEGLCNNNVDFDESKWEWVECPDSKPAADATFEDLWFAVRGGGGGTWGVVLSAYHQLHDMIPQFELDRDLQGSAAKPLLDRCGKLEDEGLSTCEALTNMTQYMWLDFVIDLLWNVEDNEIGVDEDLSLHCGCTWGDNGVFANPFTSLPHLRCQGQGIQEKFQDAWKMSVAKSKHVLAEYKDPPMSCALENLVYLKGGFFDQWFRTSGVGLPVMYPGLFYSPVGHYRDGSGIEGTYANPKISVSSYMVPGEFLASKTKEVFDFIKRNGYAGGHTLPYAFASDGMTPQPEVYRSGGLQTSIAPYELNDLDNVLALGINVLNVFDDEGNVKCQLNEDMLQLLKAGEDLLAQKIAQTLPQDYDPTSGEHIGILEFNHVFANNGGFLKSDATKPCPFTYTMEEKQANCFSVQEAAFGTDNFRRLTAIKAAIDPKKLFDVRFGIGSDERSHSIFEYCASKVDPVGPSFGEFKDISPEAPSLSVCNVGDVGGDANFPEEESVDPALAGKSGEEDGANKLGEESPAEKDGGNPPSSAATTMASWLGAVWSLLFALLAA